MPDYNLGRATGEIKLTADTRGAREAQAAMAATAGEAATLDLNMRRVTRSSHDMTRETERLGEALDSVADKLSGVARILGQAGLIGLFGGAAGGSLFASAAGGLQLLASAMSVVVEVAQDFVGAMALIPAAVDAGVLSLGTLAVAFHGVGAALSSLEDPKKFIESIRDLSPTMQQVLLNVQSFTEAMRGAREQVQESFARQFVQDIQPLITTWLPQLMRAGQAIATEWGQAFHQVFQFFQTPAAQQGFQLFVNNLVTGFQAARGAIQPLLEAWSTLATVGSQVFPRLGATIADIANQFNNWIQTSANSGQLLEFINRALDSITNIGRVVRDTSIGLYNMFEIFRGGGGTTIQTLAQISAEFRNWTQSIGGQQSIANFFNLIQVAAHAVAPQIHLLGEGLSIISGTLTRLGIAIQPGLGAFFTSFVEALRNLAPYVVQLAPAINQFLGAFGQTLLQIVNTLGPRLPGFFQDMSDAFVQIMQVLPPLVDVFARLMDHLTAGDVETILGLVVAFKALSATISVLNVVMDANPFVLMAGAIAIVITGAILLGTHWDVVKEKTGELANKFGGLHGVIDTLKRAWDNLTTAASNFWRSLSGQVSGGANSLVNSLSNLGDQIGGFFSGLWDQAVDWGTRLITNFAHGIRGAIEAELKPAIDAVAGIIPQFLKTKSPAARGPLSIISPEEMGTRLVTQYAAGMIAGRPAVDSASTSVAGSASGIGTGGGGSGGGFGAFTSSGIAGQSGKGFADSGFGQWIGFLTRDLTAWNNIFKQSFDLVQSVAGIITSTVRVVANLWNRGDNPITRPGGLMGPPGAAGQQSLFGIPSKPIPGVAPDQYGRDLAGRGSLPGQQQVPGVPSKPIPLPGQPGFIGPVAPTIPAAPVTPPAAGPAGPTTGVAPGTLPPNPSQQDVANYIHGKALSLGYTPEQADAFVVQATGESALRPSAYGATTGNETGAAQGIFQFVPGTARGIGLQDPNNAQQNIDAYFRLADRAGGPAAFTAQGPEQFLGVNVSGGGPWHPANQRDTDALTKARAAAAPFLSNVAAPPTQVAGAAVGAPGGPIPGAAVNPATRANFPLSGSTTSAFRASGDPNPPLYPPGSDTGGYGGPGQNVLPDWVKQMADRFGLVASTYPEGGTLHQAGYAFDFVPKPGVSQEEGVRNMDAFASFIQQNLTPQTLELIHFNERTGQKWGIAGAKDVAGTGYYESPNAFGEHGDYGQGAHVHWATDVPPQLPGINVPLPVPPAQALAGNIALPGLPRGPGATTAGGLQLPSDAATNIIGGGAALAGGAAAFLGTRAALGTAFRIADIPANLRTTWLRSHFNELDARAKLDVIRSLTPQEIADAGITSPDQITFGERGTGFRGLNVDLSNQPATTTGADTASVAGDVGRSGTGRALGIAGRAAGPALSLANAAIVGYGITSEATSAVERRNLATNSAAAQQGTVLGIPALGPSFPSPTLREGRPITPADTVRPPTAPPRQGGQFGQPVPGYPAQQSLFGPAAQTPGITAPPPGSAFIGGAVSTPVHITNPQQMPGGTQSPPIVQTPVRPTAGDRPITPPRPGDPGFIGPVAQQQPQLGGPPGAQRQRRGVDAGPLVGDSAGQPGLIGQEQAQGLGLASRQRDTRTPMDKFTDTMASVGSIAGDAFQVFQDWIASIEAAANIAHTLSRGFQNTEDVVGFIQQFQTFIKMASDVSKLIGDVGGAAGGASGGADMGIGSAIQAISGIVSSVLDATNAAISLGIDIYHEVGKYAGFIFGEFLGGAATGPLGGNVRMLLNTRTNQLQTYSEDNPLNKNTFNVPTWQRTYAQQPTAPALPPQVNIYTGPGQTPQGMMQESMWMVSTGSAPVASVAGLD